MLNRGFLFVLGAICFIGGVIVGNNEQLFRTTSTVPGLINTSTSTCHLRNAAVFSEIQCAQTCAEDGQCAMFKYDESGHCSTYCDIETDLVGNHGVVYIAIPG